MRSKINYSNGYKANIIFSKHETKFLETFFNDSETQKILHIAICFRSIQNLLLSRPLELLLHLDRTAYVIEKGNSKYNVALRQFFCSTISPRNIGIIINKIKPKSCRLLGI